MANINRVLVTAGENKSALAAVRALSEYGLEVHVAASRKLALARWSRFSVKGYTLPSPRYEPQAFCCDLISLQTKLHFSAILLVCDYEINAWLDWGDSLTEHELVDRVIAIPTRKAFQQARDKSQTIRSALSAGVPCPTTWFPEEHSLEEISDQARYPLLVKPNISEGARGISAVQGPDCLQSVLSRVRQTWGGCHVQEYIPPGGAQYKADVLVDREGQYHPIFVCRKVRYYPVSGGSSTLTVSERHNEIEDAVRTMIDTMGWYGFADFDFIIDPRDGKAKLMECNPRFPESLSVSIFAGANFPCMLYELICHGQISQTSQWEEGLYSRFLIGDIMWFLHSPNRLRAHPSFFRMVSPDQTYYVESLTDIKPAACSVIEAIRTVFSPSQMAYRFSRGFRKI